MAKKSSYLKQLDKGLYKIASPQDPDGYGGAPVRAANARKWRNSALFGLFLLVAAYSCDKIVDTIFDDPKKPPKTQLPVSRP
jgi:hypothetical protein